MFLKLTIPQKPGRFKTNILVPLITRCRHNWTIQLSFASVANQYSINSSLLRTRDIRMYNTLIYDSLKNKTKERRSRHRHWRCSHSTCQSRWKINRKRCIYYNWLCSLYTGHEAECEPIDTINRRLFTQLWLENSPKCATFVFQNDGVSNCFELGHILSIPLQTTRNFITRGGDDFVRLPRGKTERGRGDKNDFIAFGMVGRWSAA